MKKLLQNKTFWLTFAILLVVAGGIFAVSLIGARQSGEQTDIDTIHMAEQTTAAPPGTVIEPQTVIEQKTPYDMPENFKELLLNASVTAIDDSGFGIGCQSEFLLSGLEKLGDIPAITLQRYISVTPDYDFRLLKNESGEFLLSLDEALPQGSLLNIRLLDENGHAVKAWAFQTESELSVTYAYPKDNVWVELNQGIEMAFSSPDISLEAFRESFEIYPAVEGDFTQNGRSFIFYPTTDYKEETVYTVTIKKGLSTQSGQSLAKDYSFRFKTQNSGSGFYGFGLYGEISETFLSRETPLIAVWDDSRGESDFRLDVYRFDSVDAYAEALGFVRSDSLSDAPYDVSKLGKPWAEYTMKPVRPQDNSYTSYLVLPEDLPQGWYVVDITAPMLDREKRVTDEICHAQKFIQISDLAVSISHIGNQMLFWLNDAKTDKAVADASVTLTGGNETVFARTDKNGVAMTAVPLAEPEYLRQSTDITMKIEYPDGAFAEMIGLYDEGYGHEKDYYTYLYTDRAVYHTSDTAKLFGVIAPREKSALPEKLFAVIYPPTLYSPKTTELTRYEITPDELGAFNLSIDFEDYRADYYYYISLQDGDGTEYARTGLNIKEYQNPVYVLSTSFDKPFYEVDDKAEGVLSVKCSFFDGTPASGMALKLGMYGHYDNVKYKSDFVLDANGEAHIPFTIYNSDKNISSGLSYVSYNVSNGGGNYEESLYSNGNIPVFMRDAFIETEKTEDAVIFHPYRIDTSKLVNRTDYWDRNAYKGEACDLTIHATLQKTYWTARENGTYYDYIQKKTVTRYEYDYHEDTVETRTLNCTNGEAVFDGLSKYISDGNAYYHLSFSYSDTKGRPVYRESVSWGNYNSGSDSSYRYFGFADESGEYYGSDFTDGDDITLHLCEMNLPEPKALGGKYIAIQSSDDYFGYRVQNGDEAYIAAYDEHLLPGYYVSGFYYEDGHTYEIHSNFYYFNPEKRALTLEIATDKESYRPGEEIEVTVSVKDLSGKPAATSEVLLSLVDEAAFAVANNGVDILNGIYGARGIYRPEGYCSYRQHDMKTGEAEMAEGGGEGGGEYIRSDFVDTACFANIITDKNGEAHFRFTMPDNLTTWRITAQAYNKALHAGDKVAQTIVTQPFFISPVITSSYVAGDRAYISLHCYGTEIAGDEDVQYSVTVMQAGSESTVTAAASAHEYCYIDLGILEAGEVTLVMRADCGSHHDALQKSFEVVEGNVSLKLAKSFDLADGIDIEPSSYPVLLSFSDMANSEFHKLLGYLLNNSYAQRSEQVLTRRYVLDMLDPDGGFGSVDVSWVQPYGGGLTLFDNDKFSFTPFNVQTTALAALAFPEYLQKDGLKTYLYETVNDFHASSTDVAAAYMGLAALGEPVLLDIRYLLAGDWFEYEDGLYLLLGLYLLGDETGADQLYRDLIADRLMHTHDDVIEGESATLGAEDGEYALQFRTAMALAIATAAGKTEDATLLAAGLTQLIPDRYMYLPQLCYYAKHIEQKDCPPAVFSFMRNGERQIVELQGRTPAKLWFTREQLAEADFAVISGEIGCTAFYQGKPAAMQDEKLKLVSMNKQLMLVDGDGGPGSIYMVVLTVKFSQNAPYGGYMIEDAIPSGCRFMKIDRKWSEKWCCTDQALQHISFYYPNIDPDEAEKLYGTQDTDMTQVRYYIRTLLPGEYITEAAVISDSSSGAWGCSQAGKLGISEK